MVVSLIAPASLAGAFQANPPPNPLSSTKESADKPSREGNQRAPINDVYVIHLIIDGANYKTLWSLIEAGKMPTLKANFVDNGATFTHAISTFPSASTSAYQSFITGLLPGHAGIPHIQRFDRQKQRIVDYLSIGDYAQVNGDIINLKALQNPRSTDLDTPSIIFELLEGYPTLSLYSSIRRGATIGLPRRVPLRAAWSALVAHNPPMIDVIAFDDLIRIYGGPLDRIPRFALVGLYSSDAAGHLEGADSGLVRNVLVQFDLFLREFLELLDQRGIREKTYIIISADHGMHNTEHLFKFRQETIDRGIAVKPKSPRDDDYTLYAADRGISSTHVYTRRSDGSFAPLERAEELRRFPLKDGGSLDLIEFIRTLKPTQLLAVRNGESSVMVYDSGSNSGRIDCITLNAGDWCAYTVVANVDPLRITDATAKKLIDGRPHSSQEWKHATAGERYPDAVIQLGTIFSDGRAGDLFIVTKDDWGFRKIKHATHGSLINEDMHIALFMAGPTVPKGSFGAMRTVDIYPLLAEWFGLDIDPANHDGVDPFDGPMPENRHWQALATLEMRTAHGVNRQALARAVRSIGWHERRTLAALAAIELNERERLLRRLEEYSAALEHQLRDTLSPRIADPTYVADHLDIARRMQNVTRERLHSMQTIADIL